MWPAGDHLSLPCGIWFQVLGVRGLKFQQHAKVELPSCFLCGFPFVSFAFSLVSFCLPFRFLWLPFGFFWVSLCVPLVSPFGFPVGFSLRHHSEELGGRPAVGLLQLRGIPAGALGLPPRPQENATLRGFWSGGGPAIWDWDWLRTDFLGLGLNRRFTVREPRHRNTDSGVGGGIGKGRAPCHK